LIGKEIKPNIQNGMFGIVNRDLNLFNDIKPLALKLELDPNLLKNFMELIGPDISRTYHTAYNLCKDYTTDPSLIASLVAIFKGDLTTTRNTAEKMGMDVEVLTGVLACPRGRLDIL
jgi:tRNA A-37 threonylcarbamoyl transferase component Bud32